MEATARLKKLPFPPRKMRLVADLVRGKEVEKALGMLRHQSKAVALPMYKLLRSAITNWKEKAGEGGGDATLYITHLTVDGGPMIKRIKAAPQGRAHRIRRRSGHITLRVGTPAL